MTDFFWNIFMSKSSSVSIVALSTPIDPPGCNIRRLMRERGLNGQQLADAVAKITGADTNRSTISRYVNNVGGFTWANMHAVARALEVNVEQLMTPPHLQNLPPEVHKLLALPDHQRQPILALLAQALQLTEFQP